MDITRFAIEHKRVTYIFLIVLLISGTNAFFTLPQAEDPGFLIRTAMIQTFFPGANPERVEYLVTDKLETKLLEGHLHTCVIDGVKNGREDQVLQELVDLYAVKNIER